MLSQVKLPHNYYWRELYIPQLTTGPSSVAFMPSGDELIYSMAARCGGKRSARTMPANLRTRPGGLRSPARCRAGWRQRRLHALRRQGFELWRQTSTSGAEQALTANGGVNLEPRISPDGRQIVFVSTAGTGHFNLKIADLIARRACERALSRRAARKPDRPLLLLDARPFHQSVLVAGRQASLVRHQRRDSLGHRQDLFRRRRGRRIRVPRPAPARDFLGRAPGGRAGRQAHPLLQLPRRPVAPALADDRPTTPRRCRSPTASSTAAMPAGRPMASASRTSATRTATRRSGCRRSSAARG